MPAEWRLQTDKVIALVLQDIICTFSEATISNEVINEAIIINEDDVAAWSFASIPDECAVERKALHLVHEGLRHHECQ